MLKNINIEEFNITSTRNISFKIINTILLYSKEYERIYNHVPKVFVNLYHYDYILDSSLLSVTGDILKNHFHSDSMLAGYINGIEIYICYDYLKENEYFFGQDISDIQNYFRKEKLQKIISHL